MRKLASARISYRDDFLISYRFYMMTGSFHISLFEGTLHVDKIHLWFKIANVTHALPVPVYSIRVYMILLRDFVLESLRRHVNTPLRLDLFLSSVATDCKDAHGLKLEKVGPDFSSFNAMPVKPTKNYYTQCSFVNLFDIFFITLQGHAFCVWVKALRNLSPNINILILQTDLYIFP